MKQRLSVSRWVALFLFTVSVPVVTVLAEPTTNTPPAAITAKDTPHVCACPEQNKECIPAQVVCEVPKEELERKIKVYTACIDDNPCKGQESSAQWVSFKDLLPGDKNGVCGMPDQNGQCVGQGNRKVSIQYGTRCRKQGKGCNLIFGTKSEQCKPNPFGGQDGASIGKDGCGSNSNLSECSLGSCEVTRLDSKKDCQPVRARSRFCSWVTPTPAATPTPTGGGAGGGTTPPNVSNTPVTYTPAR